MEHPAYSYETLGLLGASTTTTDASVDDREEPYEVFRNEISLASIENTSPGTAAPDYFSLYVDGDGGEEPIQSPVSTHFPVVTPVSDRGAERKLESGWFRGNCGFKSPMLQLHKEILDFCDFLSPTPEEQAVRKAAIECVFDVIKYIWPNCWVEVFGSFKTGLYLPSSDIDVVILGSNIRTAQIGLQALSRALSQRGLAKKIQVIGKARVPIIKFIEKKSGVAFDVSFDVENGPIAADYIKDAVLKIPPLRPLCLILKVFLQQRELNEVYSGGIGSYALLAMLIAMLRNLNECQPCPEHNLGILLVKFFELYAHKLNTLDVGISCNGRGTFFLKSDRGFQVKGRPYLISIEDPQAPENDIGKNSFNYFQIRSAFMLAFSTLTNAKIIKSLGHSRSILGTIIRPDPVLLERKGGTDGKATFNGSLPGAGEPLQPQYNDKHDIVGNWQLSDDYEEPPLPRGGGIIENGGASTSGKKRKVSRSRERFSRKMKDGRAVGSEILEQNASRKETRREKKRSE
ncbi:hypothetical protein Nepgr_026797 [Nepenthes gracilis]|uniref:polynucleotide adenylyltransferase n=1 Tax=Nepenthes gracilis TaxID=150966 RepID=A0AAD3T911_NEPGR|nr:hypothetical protein Nepgr_026797 [Nepenthes gracilis]